MNESKTFLCECAGNRKIYYDVDADGLTYRPDSDETSILGWRDILYIEDRPGDRVDIYIDEHEEIPVKYATNAFSVLLKFICLKLSEIRKESFHSHKFTLTLKYSLHLNFVISVLVLSLIGSLFVDKSLFVLLLLLFVPIGIYILRQPFTLTLDHQGLIVGNLLKERAIDYNEIRVANFEVKHNDYGSVLCILIQLEDGREMTIKKFENIILFFILLQIKLNENIKR